jgi:ribosomal protein S18 acetylase RimI-like enzyme
MRSQPVFRDQINKTDFDSIKSIVEQAEVFNHAEVQIALELAEARIEKADASGYFFILAEVAQCVTAFTCFGPIPATDHRYEIYWIAVAKSAQGRGLGSAILLETEKQIAAANAKRIYTQTSSLPAYVPARNFYSKHGYTLEARLAKYHTDQDDLCIYLKTLEPGSPWVTR